MALDPSQYQPGPQSLYPGSFFTPYNGQQVMTGPSVMNAVQSGAANYNNLTGQNLTAQQYDAIINPTTYGANFGLPDPSQASGGGTNYAAMMGSSNPALNGQSAAIGTQVQDYLNGALNGIRSDAVGVGGLGGSRQGVAQGLAIAKGGQYMTNGLADLYGNNWNQGQNRALQQYGMDQNFYTSQRGQDLAQTQIGANMYGQGVQGQWSPYSNYNSTLTPYTGFGTSTTQQGGGATGAIGGALGTYQLGKLSGWW